MFDDIHNYCVMEIIYHDKEFTAKYIITEKKCIFVNTLSSLETLEVLLVVRLIIDPRRLSVSAFSLDTSCCDH